MLAARRARRSRRKCAGAVGAIPVPVSRRCSTRSPRAA